MKEKIEKLNAYFDAEKSKCMEKTADLLADDRGDEANFEKIRCNVYDIFKTVLSVAVKTKGDDEAAVRCFFAQKIAAVPSAWQSALDTAKANNNAAAIHIESLKLAAADDIRRTFEMIWGEEK